ncbi:MAG TPA: capsular biosynthesis protein [Rubrivivax sp.]|nr:capsular biosynthesis protein [Rubrivivax sp.]
MKSLPQLSPRVLKLLVIGLPLLLTALYLGVFAADRYVSESTLAVKQAGSENVSLPGAAMLLAGLSPPAREDTLYVQRYIHSLALLLKLDAELKIREHFAASRLDFLDRISRGTSQEDFLQHYRDRVQVAYDDVASLLTVRVQGFDPVFAQQLNRRILEESEHFVNEYSQQMAREKLAFAEGELKSAAQHVQEAKNQLLAFQTRHRLLDPVFQAQASGALSAELQANKARLESSLNALQTYMSDDAPQVRALRAQIAAAGKQAEAERERGTRPSQQGERLNTLAIEFQGLQMQAEFAVDAYKIALAAVENTRIEATRKLKSLVVIEPPSLPQTPEYPRRLYILSTVLAASLLVYAIVRLVLATIREHQD